MASISRDRSPGGDMENSSDRPKLSTAKWGAACGACAAAKAKCIHSNLDPESKCDRCQRLFKDCAPQVHRPRKKRQAKPSRTAQIEERLNGLVTLLKASGDLSKADVDPEKLSGLLNASVTPSTRSSTSPNSKTFENNWSIPEHYNIRAPPSCICRAESGEAPPPPESDEALLNIYRTQLLPAHPFVVIPPTMSAASLKSQRPFLMSAIRMVASFRSLRSMKAQMYHLMRHISEKTLIESERSLDLLLGIIVIIGWYQYHCFTHAQLTSLIGLAKTVAGDLMITRPPTRTERSILMVVKPIELKPRTNEERRALLGIYFLSSSLGLGFGRVEPMKYTRYLHQLLLELEDNMEYETDSTLVNLVRIQNLSERIADCVALDSGTEETPMFPTTPPTPRGVYVAAFQNELDTLRANLPPLLKMDKIFQTYLNTAALRLHQPPSIDSNLINSLSESLSSFEAAGPSLDDFYQSHSALITWFNTWLSVPVSTYYCQTTATCSLIVYGISMLGRWAKLVTPATLSSGKTPIAMPDDPSYDRRYHDLPPRDHPSVSSGVSSAATPTASEASLDKEPCGYGDHNIQTKADPTLPAAVATLQARLKQQPGLNIDIAAILSTIQQRFQQAGASLQASSVDGESKDPNVWGMSAIKLLITRAKLERWADLVAAGTEALSLEDRVTQDSIMGDVGGNPLQDGFLDGADMTMNMGSFGDGLGADWMMDLMPQMQQMQGQMQSSDPAMWFDGYVDWSSIVMNSMGSAEQQEGEKPFL